MLSNETLHDVCCSLNKELDRGLTKDTNKEATIKCFPTFVQELPNGEGKAATALVLPADPWNETAVQTSQGMEEQHKLYCAYTNVMTSGVLSRLFLDTNYTVGGEGGGEGYYKLNLSSSCPTTAAIHMLVSPVS